jgi:uncharacterized protein YndB with AHSA1/START domain
MSPRELIFRVRIEAPVETVFAFFMDATKMAQWLATSALIEPHPGGTFTVANDRDIGQGRYLEIEPNRRLLFTWGWQAGPYAERLPPGASTVEVTLERDGRATRLTLIHRGLSDDMHEVHRQGWRHCLPRLRLAASGLDPGVDNWAAGCQAVE